MRRNLSRSFTCANVVVGGVLQPARRAADHGHLPVGQGSRHGAAAASPAGMFARMCAAPACRPHLSY
jgi:hypothetical protein